MFHNLLHILNFFYFFNIYLSMLIPDFLYFLGLSVYKVTYRKDLSYQAYY